MPTSQTIDHEIIEFVDTSAGRIKRRGYRIGDYLIVSYASTDDKSVYRIFRKDTGKEFLSLRFGNLEDTVNFAEWIDNLYAPYFPIWLDYPQADIVGLARWSIKNGRNIFDLIQKMRKEKQKISLGAWLKNVFVR